MKDRFGPYTVFEQVGIGGMATVHRATVERGGVTYEVALKRLLPELQDDAESVRDFVREAKIAAQLDHANIVRVFHIGSAGRIHYIAMELLRGAPLQRLLRRTSELRLQVPIPIVLAVIHDLLRGLDYAQHGLDETGERFDLLHRDVSPSNVFVTEAGVAKLIDFGVAKTQTGRFMTQSGLAKGKLGYMASEALAADPLDARADVFSVGVIAWEMLVGKRLFTVTDDWMPAREDVVRPPSELAPHCPRTLDNVVLRALAPDREERWASAHALAQALEDPRRGLPARALPAEVARWVDDLTSQTDTTTRPAEFAVAPRFSTGDIIEDLDVPTRDRNERAERAERAERNDPAGGFDEARTLEAQAIDLRFDVTGVPRHGSAAEWQRGVEDDSPFAADDRSVLGEESPFFPDDGPQGGVPSVPTVPALPPPVRLLRREPFIERDTAQTKPYPFDLDVELAAVPADEARTTDRGQRMFSEDTKPETPPKRRR